MDIIDGQVLVTTKDLTNPKPDRRQRHDWREEVTIPKGFKFVVIVREGDGKYEPGYISLRPVSTRWSSQDLTLKPDGTVPEHGSYGALTALVMDNLKEGEHTFETMARYHWTESSQVAYDIVKEMLATGRLSLREAEALYKAYQERES